MRSQKRFFQCLITRLPYQEAYDAKVILEQSKSVEARGLICLSIPIHVYNPMGPFRLVQELVDQGLHLVAMVCWYRDRHVVVSQSRRLTNKWEPIAIFSRSQDYILSKDEIRQLKKGFEGKQLTFDAEEFLTCQGDHWAIKNDRRDRRFLPAAIVLNCGQLGDLKPGDTVLDPWGNFGIKDACKLIGWKYHDAGLPSQARGVKKPYAATEESE